jgi:hypothetical protein
MTARSGQCASCKAYYWVIDGVIVRHIPSKPVTNQPVQADDLCPGAEKAPLGAVAGALG